MEAELKLAIDTANELFRTRDAPEHWSENIIQATRHLTTRANWTKFYAFMANAEAFDHNDELKTLADCTEECDLSYPDELGLEEVRYGNGPGETIIHVRKRVHVSQDDEKEPVLCDEKVQA